MLNERPEPVQSIDQPADATESETGSDMPVFSRGAFFQFLDSFNPNGERRRRRRDKGKQPAEGATLPPNPKGFFANERTFLSWMQLCLILGALAMSLLNFGDRVGQSAGIIFAIIAVVVMFYSLIQFWARADQLQKKEKGASFEDMIGALVLVAVVFLAVGINFGLRFIKNDKLEP